MAQVDLLFTVVGTRLPTDHAYPLYASLCHLSPVLHDSSVPLGMEPITGQYVGNGVLRLDPVWSRLRLRLPVEAVPQVLVLAGKAVRVLGLRVQLGTPRVFALQSAPSLLARTVTIKHATDVGGFLQAARTQADALGIGGRLEVPVGLRRGELRRHVLRIKDKRVICFPLLVHDLTAQESLRLQEAGLGGRRRMGGGVFVPAAE